jgi:hypothetical protein
MTAMEKTYFALHCTTVEKLHNITNQNQSLLEKKITFSQVTTVSEKYSLVLLIDSEIK